MHNKICCIIENYSNHIAFDVITAKINLIKLLPKIDKLKNITLFFLLY